MATHTSIEAAAVVVGLILLAMLVTTIVIAIIVIWMRSKMREQSKFSIQISRNYSRGESFRAKESPISDDLDQQALKNRTLDLKLDAIDTLDNPLYQQTTSFSPTTTFPESTNGFANPQSEEESLTDSDSSPKLAQLDEERYIEHTTDTKEDLANAENIQVTPSKPVPLQRPSNTPSSRRAPPMMPIIKPKPYVRPTLDKPPISEKPAVTTKPPRMQPILPPTDRPPAENQETGVKAKPGIKPKPKALPRKV